MPPIGRTSDHPLSNLSGPKRLLHPCVTQIQIFIGQTLLLLDLHSFSPPLTAPAMSLRFISRMGAPPLQPAVTPTALQCDPPFIQQLPSLFKTTHQQCPTSAFSLAPLPPLLVLLSGAMHCAVFVSAATAGQSM